MLLLSFIFFFFFKQKTAYEMRISDWSSDVCSSDLVGLALGRGACGALRPRPAEPPADAERAVQLQRGGGRRQRHGEPRRSAHGRRPGHAVRGRPRRRLPRRLRPGEPRSLALHDRDRPVRQSRSEEHTSELQSLMRISYAVFCLKKKK